MNEIEVGEYVRTNEGEIAKVIKIEKRKNLEDKIFLDIIMEYIIYNFDIKAHSKNIVDLIEVGDFVNGVEVVETANNKFIDEKLLKNTDIKTIVTKELFNSVMYKVVE